MNARATASTVKKDGSVIGNTSVAID